MFLLVGPIWCFVEKEIERESLNRSIGRADGSLFFVGANYPPFPTPPTPIFTEKIPRIFDTFPPKGPKKSVIPFSTRPSLNNALTIAH